MRVLVDSADDVRTADARLGNRGEFNARRNAPDGAAVGLAGLGVAALKRALAAKRRQSVVLFFFFFVGVVVVVFFGVFVSFRCSRCSAAEMNVKSMGAAMSAALHMWRDENGLQHVVGILFLVNGQATTAQPPPPQERSLRRDHECSAATTTSFSVEPEPLE